jgi:hypothetical protein
MARRVAVFAVVVCDRNPAHRSAVRFPFRRACRARANAAQYAKPAKLQRHRESDPVGALAKIMPPEQILRVDVPKLVIPVAEMGAAVKQMTAFDRLSKKSAAIHRVL